ncbi:unnamed protein product [Adineta ricciae]|uniref:peptide chain release factor N(5)-glutamine methyltransferase n=1 Tax=Adineta ricciae TaxID=249248 RepID=A0A813SC35_ADIRI|nr:unnamed protein product [Adineta ricciae]CAF1349800.1 unnamed protein product [Adineta ricciae]
MRSLRYILRHRKIDEFSTYAYRWLYSRAQYLHHRSQSHIISKSLFGIFRSLVERYHCHVPMEYLCGSAMFCNRLFIVNQHVLIPRRDSETLIHHVQELYRHNHDIQSMLEIGTGSGCLSITLSRLFPHWKINTCDISPSALRVARSNAHLYHCHNIQFHRGNLFDTHFLENTSYNLIISNPPYVSQDQLSACNYGIFHEPSIALFANPPLKFYAEIIRRAINGWLKDQGYLVFECSPFNVIPIQELLKSHFEQIEIRYDETHLARVISAKRKQE